MIPEVPSALTLQESQVFDTRFDDILYLDTLKEAPQLLLPGETPVQKR